MSTWLLVFWQLFWALVIAFAWFQFGRFYERNNPKEPK